MRISFLIGIALFALLGCEQGNNQPRKLNAYFDLDSLLDEQVYQLAAIQATLKKTVIKDQQDESRTFVPDTSYWKDEFEIIREFNINMPVNVGAYTTVTAGNSTKYVPKEGLDLPVQQFEIDYYKNGQLKSISASLNEFKYIYFSDRKVTMEFADGLLTNYLIDGTQSMILLDGVDYQISGTITINE